MPRVIIVNIFAVDAQDIGRRPGGEPYINSDTQRYRLHMATPDGDGWLLETWAPGDDDEPHQSSIAAVADVDHLAASITAALHTIVTEE